MRSTLLVQRLLWSAARVITLAVFGQWAQFKSERAFSRYAESHLRAAFPQLPDRAQFNRLLRHHRDAIRPLVCIWLS